MGLDFVPTGILTGVAGSVFAAPQVVTLAHGAVSVIAAGVYWLYATDADMDLEVVTSATTPTWTKIKDGDAAPLGVLIMSDGTNVRLHNSHASTDGEVASLIKIG
jgi:hypothetical protein